MSRIHRQKPERTSPATRHISVASQDTTASAIADSTISYGESLRLSQFPNPPSSLPTTPVRSDYGAPPGRSNSTAPLVPNRKRPPAGVVEPSSASAASGGSGAADSTRSNYSGSALINSRPMVVLPYPPSLPSRALSPHDWHEGASSIDVDATEDRLLPTSFITSLLQENRSLRANHRLSVGSDAFSGISEMTYPPLSGYLETQPNHSTNNPRFSSQIVRSPSNQRPLGARPPPGAFMSIPELPDRTSGDSAILYHQDPQQHSVIGTASVSRGLRVQGASVVGVMPATLHTVSSKHDTVATSNYSWGAINGVDDDKSGANEFGGAAPRYSSALASTAASRFYRINSGAHQKRESMHSAKSAAPSFLSRISSNRSFQRVFTPWRTAKPLPPVPLIPHIPVATEREHRRADEVRPLPELVHRAGALQGMLENGYHPHQSLNSYYTSHQLEGLTSTFNDASTQETSGLGPHSRKLNPGEPWPDSPKIRRGFMPRKKKRALIILGIFIIVAIVAIGTAVGVAVRRKAYRLPNCSGNFTGVACDLDATCVCTSPSSRCDGLAKSIVDLVPTMNRLFVTNLSSNAVYRTVWLAQGATTRNNCASQSLLVDVAPALDLRMFPNRTQWAQSALLWNLVQSQDIQAVSVMQKFVVGANWKQLGSLDGPVPDSVSFSTTVSGFKFNFAAQEVTQPSASFVASGEPTYAQIAQVGSTAMSALDRMYSFAIASSTQRQKALISYWTTALQQKPEDLPTFVSALRAAPILLPFDATFAWQSQNMAAVLDGSPSTFPPPLGCYPGLESTQVEQINTIEGQVFGLSPLSNAARFDSACYPDRPVYGVLDILRLRLPFLDSRTSVGKQAVTVNKPVVPRAVVYSGEVLSALPGSSNALASALVQPNPRQYGTFSHINHIILQYLSSIPDINVAIALVQFILTSSQILPAIPPSNTSFLYQSLASIPTLEVAIFGTIEHSDISSVVSSFTTPTGAMFFGSDQGASLRQWALADVKASFVTWAESAISPLIVRDPSLSEPIFSKTWVAASLILSNNVTDAGLQNVTDTLAIQQRFTPS